MNSHQRPSESPWRSTLPSRLACTPRLDPSELQLYRTVNHPHQQSKSSKARPYVPLDAVNTSSSSGHASLRRRRTSYKKKGSSMPLLDICENKLPYFAHNEAMEGDEEDSTSSGIPLARRLRRAMSTSSNHSLSKSQRTHATATTGSFESSSTNPNANANHRPAQMVFQQLPTKPDSKDGNSNCYTSQRPPLPPLSSCYQTAPPSLTVTASSSITESEVSFLSYHHHEDDAADNNNNNNNLSYDEEERQTSQQESLQLQFWRSRATACLDQYGIQHGQTANAFLELGLAHVRCEQYTAAQDFFRTALRVFEKQFGPRDLRVAKAWEALGVAQSRCISATTVAALTPSSASQSSSSSSTFSSTTHSTRTSNKAGLLLGLQSFRKAFRIRYDLLGPTSIDTVELLNKCATNYMKLGMLSSAKNDYMEVLTLRTAILGPLHPSVAVAAQSLGMAHWRSNEHEQAKAYFLQALNVFAMSGLGDHPMAERLRDDVKTIGFDLTRVEI